MKWKSAGMIFEANKYGFEYAKSPHALIYKDYVRVYFSACRRDGIKLISYVAYADFDKEFKNVLRVSDHEVLSRGKLGCFDEHGIFPFSPLRYQGKIYGYTSGWSRRTSVSVDTGIGIVVSEDNGTTFKRMGDGPILTSSLQEPFLVIDGFVLVINQVFHMWYIYGTGWKIFEAGKEPDRIYKIAHATSSDGINWRRDGRAIIPDRLEYEAQALPSVIWHKDRYHMYFCYREAYDFRNNPSRSYRIGYAYSFDLVDWIRADEVFDLEHSNLGWDSEMLCYPHVFEMDGELYMLYNGNSFGKFGFGLAKIEKEV